MSENEDLNEKGADQPQAPVGFRLRVRTYTAALDAPGYEEFEPVLVWDGNTPNGVLWFTMFDGLQIVFPKGEWTRAEARVLTPEELERCLALMGTPSEEQVHWGSWTSVLRENEKPPSLRLPLDPADSRIYLNSLWRWGTRYACIDMGLSNAEIVQLIFGPDEPASFHLADRGMRGSLACSHAAGAFVTPVVKGD